jgi:hypothetical protein
MAEQQTVLRVLRLMRVLRKRPMNAEQMLNSDGVTKRTIHRYIGLLKELNLNVQRDVQNRYWIEDKNDERGFALDDLLPEETTFLKNLIQQHAPDNIFTEGVNPISILNPKKNQTFHSPKKSNPLKYHTLRSINLNKNLYS